MPVVAPSARADLHDCHFIKYQRAYEEAKPTTAEDKSGVMTLPYASTSGENVQRKDDTSPARVDSSSSLVKKKHNKEPIRETGISIILARKIASTAFSLLSSMNARPKATSERTAAFRE
jgi:hypothetical protein